MTDLNLPAWMAELDDDALISDLAIPGTHDTMTSSCDQRYYHTQTLTLAEQLKAGARFLDLRLRKSLKAAHREWISDITADQIFDQIGVFLEQNPSETLILRVQNANENKDDFPAYSQAIKRALSPYFDFFHRPQPADTGNDMEPSAGSSSALKEETNHSFTWPKLGEVRGRVVAFECAPPELQVNYLEGKPWAFSWHGNDNVVLQDLWNGPSEHDKLAAIKANLEQSRVADNKLYLNHISASNGELKYPDAYANALNPRVEELFGAAHSKTGRFRGVQIFDFLTPELSEIVVRTNRLLRSH